MENLLNIIQENSQNSVTDFHFQAGKKPYIRKLGKIVELSNYNTLLNSDITDLISKTCNNKKKLAEFKANGSCDFGFSLDNIGNFRANLYYSKQNLFLAIRILPSKIPDFSSLGLSDAVKNVLKLKSGLILVTGLTGNGKSTTIASLINEINKTLNKHIIIIEDPIEYRYTSINSLISQREVGLDCPSFDEGLRSALRQDPDVIVIGEMRDKETISVALEAAESGHLVFSTLHTCSASSSMDRIISYFDTDEQLYLRNKLASVLKAVFSQKLLVGNNNNRYIAMEIMFNNSAIKNLIREGKFYQIQSFLQISKDEGMITMEESLAKLCSEKKISPEVAIENANDEKQFNLIFNQYKIKQK